MDVMQMLDKEAVQKQAAARAVPEFRPGDTLKVMLRVIEGERERARIRLICGQALAAAGDPRAAHFLELAYGEVQSTAARISDPDLKDSFLRNHPTNRAIVAAWEARAEAARLA